MIGPNAQKWLSRATQIPPGLPQALHKNANRAGIQDPRTRNTFLGNTPAPYQPPPPPINRGRMGSF